MSWEPRQNMEERAGSNAASKYLANIGDAARRQPHADWRERGYEIIFKADTRAGKAFDLWLIVAILASVAVVMVASVKSIKEDNHELLNGLEWGFTILFSVEYILRLMCAPKPKRYALGFWGLVDLFSILPTFVNVLFPGAKVLVVLRTVRIMRLFQILKLGRYVDELDSLNQAIRKGFRKIMVFVYAVSTLVVILGAVMYLAEGDQGGFTSIPRSVYWAIVTMTTVGYGDISPVSPIGQTIAAVVMLMGYSIIVIPTGIVSAELFRSDKRSQLKLGRSDVVCAACAAGAHDSDAQFCKLCGGQLQSLADELTNALAFVPPEN